MAELFGFHIPGTKRVDPEDEAGTSGTAVFGGFVENNEKNPALGDGQRYQTASDLLGNISTIGASVRYFLNLLSAAEWEVTPADDSKEAQDVAKFVLDVTNDMEISWSRVIRNAASYRFYGFSTQEWVAKDREDGKIGFRTIESRSQHTVRRWEVNETGNVIGIYQTSPQTGQELPIDRWKLVYMVDDVLTDSPEGLGWFRHLVEPATRLKEYLRLEKIGFERDMSGVPIGRAPITALNKAVKAGQLTQQQADNMVKGLKKFVQAEIKKENTGMVLDSQTFEGYSAEGAQPTGVHQWGIDLLKGDPGAIDELGAAIKRINVEMARIIGTESIMSGEDGRGSLAMVQDKSSNLYVQIESTLKEIREQFDKDIIGPLMILNGIPEKLRPKFKTGDIAPYSVEQITKALGDMSTAGALLTPDDPVINELRVMMGIPKQPDDLVAHILEDMRNNGIDPEIDKGTADPEEGSPNESKPTSEEEM